MGYSESQIEGRNAVIEAFRSGKTIDKLFILDGCQDGPMATIRREVRKQPDCIVKYVSKERLDQMSESGKHQGVIAVVAAYEYAEVEDILKAAEDEGEEPFLFLLDDYSVSTVMMVLSRFTTRTLAPSSMGTLVLLTARQRSPSIWT